MKSILKSALLAALALASVVSTNEEFTYEHGVLVATGENIDKIIEHFNGTFLLELYAPWWYLLIT